jgi:hypothetical protein
LIAKKREVAARILQVFRGANVKFENWRQVTVQSKESLTMSERTCVSSVKHTAKCTVTACRT